MPDQYGVPSWRERHPHCQYKHNPLNRMHKVGAERLHLKNAAKLWLDIMQSLELVDLTDHSNGRFVGKYITLFSQLEQVYKDNNLTWGEIVQVGTSMGLRQVAEGEFDNPEAADRVFTEFANIYPGLIGIGYHIVTENASGVCPCGSMHDANEVIEIQDASWVDDLLN